MTTNANSPTRTYPREITLGKAALTLRLMSAEDKDAVLAFARSLPPNDLLFLRLDIATDEGVNEWVNNIVAGRTTTVLALPPDGSIAGYASVHHNDALWNRHVGELRVIVGSEYRRHGLGRRLTDEVFAIARELGLQKLTAQMTPDQKGARATFQRRGFRAGGLGAGFGGGREGPGGPVGECLGAGWAKLTGTKNPDDLRVYMMAGIVAAVATLLDAPFTAALFAAEIIYLDRILYRTLIYSAPGAIVAYALNNHFLLFEPLFAAPQRSHVYSMTEYAQVALVALFCSAPAGLGGAFVVTWLKKLLQGVPSLPHPAVSAKSSPSPRKDEAFTAVRTPMLRYPKSISPSVTPETCVSMSNSSAIRRPRPADASSPSLEESSGMRGQICRPPSPFSIRYAGL